MFHSLSVKHMYYASTSIHLLRKVLKTRLLEWRSIIAPRVLLMNNVNYNKIVTSASSHFILLLQSALKLFIKYMALEIFV